MIKKELLDILCCPKCKGGLLYKAEDNILLCTECGKKYDVKNDIPIMLVDETDAE